MISPLPPPGTAEPQLGTPPPAPRWYSRGYLPHFDSPQVAQAITFRLADSLPQEKLQAFELELASRDFDKSAQQRERRRQIEEWLDAGMGSCALGHPALAAMMEETLLKFDGDRYRLLAWCIMPNHVHVLIAPSAPLGKIVQSWKSFMGRWALGHWAELGLGDPGRERKKTELGLGGPGENDPGRDGPGKNGAFWMREYWDRYIRDADHYQQTIRYIHQNPVKAELCAAPEDWRWSSARLFPGKTELQLGPASTLPGHAEPQLGSIQKGSATK